MGDAYDDIDEAGGLPQQEAPRVSPVAASRMLGRSTAASGDIVSLTAASQEVIEAVVNTETFQDLLATALDQELTFMTGDREQWMKMSAGVCRKIVDLGANSSDAPTARAPGSGSVPERDPGHGSEPS